MSNPALKSHSKESGFTLVELMVVVAIIAILASIAAPRYNAYLKSSEASEAVTTAAFIHQNMQAYTDIEIARGKGTTEIITNGFAAYPDLVPTAVTVPTASVGNMIPALSLADDAAFGYTISAALDTTTGEIHSCIIASKVTTAGNALSTTAQVLYSSRTSTLPTWSGNSYLVRFIDETTAFPKGGACDASQVAQITSQD